MDNLEKYSINKLLELLEQEITEGHKQGETRDYYLEHLANKSRIEGEIIERINKSNLK